MREVGRVLRVVLALVRRGVQPQVEDRAAELAVERQRPERQVRLEEINAVVLRGRASERRTKRGRRRQTCRRVRCEMEFWTQQSWHTRAFRPQTARWRRLVVPQKPQRPMCSRVKTLCANR